MTEECLGFFFFKLRVSNSSTPYPNRYFTLFARSHHKKDHVVLTIARLLVLMVSMHRRLIDVNFRLPGTEATISSDFGETMREMKRQSVENIAVLPSDVIRRFILI
jgi:hypothetical protein